MGILDNLWRLARPYSEDEEEPIEEVVGSTRRDKRGESIPDTRPRDKVVNIHTTTQFTVAVFKPSRFDSAVEIADHLREKRSVVLCLEQADKVTSSRLTDFLGGVAYALSGNIQRVANETYFITPYNVDVVGDAILGELENNGLYF